MDAAAASLCGARAAARAQGCAPYALGSSLAARALQCCSGGGGGGGGSGGEAGDGDAPLCERGGASPCLPACTCAAHTHVQRQACVIPLV